MNKLRFAIATSLLALTLPLSGVVRAQATDAVAAASAPAPAPAAVDMTEGEVRKVDKENRKLTLKHGPIKNLDMPGMTMVFYVQDLALLEKVQPGDKVRFAADKVDGKFTVTKMEAGG